MGQKEIERFLAKLNETYIKLHRDYEELFWISYMGDHSVDEKFKQALKARDTFRADHKLLNRVEEATAAASPKLKKRLSYWRIFFRKFQIPAELLKLKSEIDNLENQIQRKMSSQMEGYIDPYTKKFVKASKLQMRTMTRTHDDEKVRKACFEAIEKLSTIFVDDYIKLVAMRNKYAQALGFRDFYAYKAMNEEGMSSDDIFAMFDKIYGRTKYAFNDIRKLEAGMPGLRKPWNFGYMMAGDFTKEEDPYFQFDDALIRWGRSFAALGINFLGGQLKLDLLDRRGKFNNGFCHYPKVVHFKKRKRIPAAANLTCNVVYGQLGSGIQGMTTLFHEGGHAADRLNCQQLEACLNTEYPPASTAWAETQSMFMDTMFASIEWKIRYATNSTGKSYPFELFVRKVKKLQPLMSLDLMPIMFVSNFERNIYSAKNLTRPKVLKLAYQMHKKYFDQSVNSSFALSVPHIYSWESACSYHGYGLAELAVSQWRDYFYKKYGYIVDNKKVGKEMAHMWSLGSSITFNQAVKIATGKGLSPNYYIDDITRSYSTLIKLAKQRIKKLSKVSAFVRAVDLNADISIVHGKQVVASNKRSFEDMAKNYKKFFHSLGKNATKPA